MTEPTTLDQLRRNYLALAKDIDELAGKFHLRWPEDRELIKAIYVAHGHALSTAHRYEDERNDRT